MPSLRRRPLDIWPAFVDATASLLMVVIFVLLLAIIGHLVLSSALTSRDNALAELNAKITKLSEILSLEKTESARLEKLLALKSASLDDANQQIAAQQFSIDEQQAILDERAEKIKEQQALLNQRLQTIDDLEIEIKALTALRDRIQEELEKQIAENTDIKSKLEKEAAINIENLAQLELLNRQMEELRQQLSAISKALEIAEKDNQLKQEKIDDLGSRLNVALANKAAMLQKYRSEFFGRLRDALSQYPDIRIEGDRFVFPSELLFASGSAQLGEDGLKQVKQLATTLAEVAQVIPNDIDWILRIDGHTDKRPIINNAEFKSNWELSTARAISIVREMMKQGIAADKMAATGFAEFHPIDTADTPEAYAKNRRIELKLTSR